MKLSIFYNSSNFSENDDKIFKKYMLFYKNDIEVFAYSENNDRELSLKKFLIESKGHYLFFYEKCLIKSEKEWKDLIDLLSQNIDIYSIYSTDNKNEMISGYQFLNNAILSLRLTCEYSYYLFNKDFFMNALEPLNQDVITLLLKATKLEMINLIENKDIILNEMSHETILSYTIQLYQDIMLLINLNPLIKLDSDIKNEYIAILYNQLIKNTLYLNDINLINQFREFVFTDNIMNNSLRKKLEELNVIKIPKIIHYCWFGKSEMNSLQKKCMDSWKMYLSEYKFVEWNEENIDITSCPIYVQEAYACKKYAFVTDYVRLYVLYMNGGIYMDTDVEVLRKLDQFLVCNAFSGYESANYIPTGIMGCEKGFPLFKEFLKYYDNRHFLIDGKPDKTTNVVTISNLCTQKGYTLHNQLQSIEGFVVFPKEYFCPLYGSSYTNFTQNTYAIHHFNASWLKS